MIEKILRQQPVEGRAMFIDMNSFFASVEQQANPELRGKPVGVCPFVSNATCVIAASVEAKTYGVKTGMRVPDARRLCPQIILVPNKARRYREWHRKIMAELDQTRCQVHIKSIDEAFLEVPRELAPNALELGAEIKSQIRNVGSELRSSIGISSNMFLAKMGTNFYKPDGLIQIKLADLEAFYYMLKLTDLHGISWRMARRLRAIGIETPLDFYRAPFELLKKSFGVNGERWYLRLRGYEVDKIQTHRRMIGHQNTITPNPATTKMEVLSVANELAYKAAVRMRSAELAATSVAVWIRYNDRTYWGRVLRTHSPFFDSRTFYDHVQTILRKWTLAKPVRLVSVTAFDLVPFDAMTLGMFDRHDKSESLSAALDAIEHRWGRFSIRPASQLITGELSDQVGFGNAAQTVKELEYVGG